MRQFNRALVLFTVLLSSVLLVACTSSKQKEQAVKEAQYRVKLVSAQQMIVGSAAEDLGVAEQTRANWSKAIDFAPSNWEYWFKSYMTQVEVRPRFPRKCVRSGIPGSSVAGCGQR
jgi:outer membrane murein-binding lipoprotein Lpp